MKNKRKFKGQISFTYLILYTFQRIWVEQLRTDSLMLGSIRISQALSAIVFLILITVYIRKLFFEKSTK